MDLEIMSNDSSSGGIENESHLCHDLGDQWWRVVLQLWQVSWLVHRPERPKNTCRPRISLPSSGETKVSSFASE